LAAPVSVDAAAWAFGCGAGLATVLGRLRGPTLAIPGPGAAWRRRGPLAGLAVLGVALAVAVIAIPDARLLAHQRRLQRGLGDPEVAAALADLRASGRLAGKVIAGPDVLLAYAPGWDSLFVITSFTDAARLAADAARPDVGWLLLPDDAERAPMLASRDGSGWRVERSFARAELWRREARP